MNYGLRQYLLNVFSVNHTIRGRAVDMWHKALQFDLQTVTDKVNNNCLIPM